MPEDLTPVQREAIAESVRDATGEAFKQNSIRSILLAVAVGLIAGCLIAIPVSKAISTHNAKVNCENISDLAGLGQKRVVKEAAAIEDQKKKNADFKAKSKDRLGLSEADFDKLIAEGEAKLATEVQEAKERQIVYERIKQHNC